MSKIYIANGLAKWYILLMKNFEMLKEKVNIAIKWLLLSAAIGVVSGIIGAAFAHGITFVTQLRDNHGWLLYLLPAGGLLSVLWYNSLRVRNIGTNQVLKSIKGENSVSIRIVPAVFISSVISHLFGASAGREGAALQIGGGLASGFSGIFKLNDNAHHIATICGMAAVFSAIFGTPVGAAVFAVEVVFSGRLCLKSIIPALISSTCAFAASSMLKTEPERFRLVYDTLSFTDILKILLLAVAGTFVAVIFAFSLHLSEKVFKKVFVNEFVRIFAGGLAIVGLTVLAGTTDYNGGGINVITRIFETGDVKAEAFVLKLIFTCITVAAGFKGGEIIPTLFIGATFGGAAAVLLGLTPAVGAAVGMAVLFCGVTNCPVATVVLCCEMCGIKSLPVFAAVSFIAFVLSGKGGLYSVDKPYIGGLTLQKGKR